MISKIISDRNSCRHGRTASDERWLKLMPQMSNIYEYIDTSTVEFAQSIQYMTTPAPDSKALPHAFRRQNVSLIVDSGNLNTYLLKMENFESSHIEDMFL